MNDNEKIYVRAFRCSTAEDTWENGEIDGTYSYWGDADLPVTGAFDSIEDALKAVCEVNSFTYVKDNWTSYGDELGEDYGRFDGDFLVDENGSEATEFEKSEWKAGNRRLWICHTTVYLEIRAVRELTPDEANEF